MHRGSHIKQHSDIPKSPMTIGTIPSPSRNVSVPYANRNVPVCGSIPTEARINPSGTIINP